MIDVNSVVQLMSDLQNATMDMARWKYEGAVLHVNSKDYVALMRDPAIATYGRPTREGEGVGFMVNGIRLEPGLDVEIGTWELRVKRPLTKIAVHDDGA